MWFRSVYLKTLRDYRIPILGWGVGMGLVIVSPMASVAALVSTPQARAALLSLAQSFAWNADPVKADTIGGYATFKIGTFVFLICVWPLLAATRMLRGEEDRASLDVLLSAPRGRVRVAAEKVAAMWTALAMMAVVIGLIASLGGLAFKADFSVLDGLLLGLNVALIAAVIGAVGLFASQFTNERGPAAGITAGVLLIFIVVDMVHRVFPGTDWLSRLSPIYYYNLSKPLIPTFGTSAGGMLVMASITAVLTAAALWLFARRDIGGAIRLPGVSPPRAAKRASALPGREWTLGSVYARSLGMIALPTVWWTLAIAGFATWLVVAVEQMVSRMQTLYESSPVFQQLLASLGGGDAGLDASFLSAMFEFLPVLLMAFVVTQVNGWSADEGDGRLELVLATPHRRAAVMLGRFAALATATILIGAATLIAAGVGAATTGIRLDPSHLVEAALGMVPLGLLIAAIGYLGSGWLRSAADTGLLSLLLGAWFLVSFVGPDLRWPDGALRLSPFYYYGSPLLHGLQPGNVALVLVVAAIALAGAALRFSRKDLAA